MIGGWRIPHQHCEGFVPPPSGIFEEVELVDRHHDALPRILQLLQNFRGVEVASLTMLNSKLTSFVAAASACVRCVRWCVRWCERRCITSSSPGAALTTKSAQSMTAASWKQKR
jgi:hypothetical protein